MRLRSNLLAAAVAISALGLGACGAGSDPLGSSSAQPGGSGSASGSGSSSSSGSAPASGPVIVGSANFTESQVLAELYAQAMRAKGVNATTKLNIGSREVYIKALQDKSISVIPEYTGNLLLYFDKTSKAASPAQVEAALPKAVGSLKVLKSSAAADQDVYVVAKQYSQQNGVTSLADLKKVSGGAVLGGPSELKDRAYGPMGLKSQYGATFKQFKPYDSPAVKVKDLNDGKLQVAEFFTTESAIADNGYVALKDPKSMILPQNIIPLLRPEVATNSAATGAIQAVQSALTTQELTALNKKVDVDHDDPNQVATDWLKSKNLG